ncbi:DNA polymerase III subunit chi [Rickettsiales bacterium]|nr:DNA polymerase III subunit chi [Rickettsiales bacterium]MDB2550566.1 DNA polymerase III subunit chi [Rickettsiales bacterium]
MEINFYQIDDLLHKMIAPLLLKIYDQQKKALILCENDDMTQKLDLGLWNFSKIKFLPHITDQDDFELESQPILLTQREESLNEADFLLMFSEKSEEFMQKFDRIFYFFGANDLSDARKFWKESKEKSYNLNFYKREVTGWKKQEI